MGRELGKRLQGHESRSETHTVGTGRPAQMKPRLEGLEEGRHLLSVGSGNSTHPARASWGTVGEGERRGQALRQWGQGAR